MSRHTRALIGGEPRPSRVTKHRPAKKRGSRLILVLGGASSGKSEAALELAGQAWPKAFVATAQALDREMAGRIARHQAARASEWETSEVPLDLSSWFRTQGPRYRTIVLDCVTLWLSNLQGDGVDDERITDRVADLLMAIRATPARIVIVSNELGLGLVPMGRSSRRFREMTGRVNQQLAAEADEVRFIVSGQTMRLK